MKAPDHQINNQRELSERLNLLRQRRSALEAELTETGRAIEAVIRDPSVFIKENIHRLAADKHVWQDLFTILVNWAHKNFPNSSKRPKNGDFTASTAEENQSSFLANLIKKILRNL